MHIQELARRLEASVDPDSDVEIEGVATIEDAGPTDLTFLANDRYAAALRESGAGAVLVSDAFEDEITPVCLRLANPYLAFAQAIDFFYRPPAPPRGVHPTAVIGERATIGEDVSIGAYVVLGDDVVVGDNAVIHPHVVVYAGARIGPAAVIHSQTAIREHVVLGPGVIIQNGSVIGGDGFGFAPRGNGSWQKMTQAGTVELGPDVEIQANTCIDRATIGTTRIGRGTKVDNLVQIGHGSKIGEDTLLCGQVGLAGSTTIGDRVTLAGQVGVAGHCVIEDGVQVASQSGVPNGLKAGANYGGTPALEHKHIFRVVREWTRLPELAKRVKALEQAVAKDEAGDG